MSSSLFYRVIWLLKGLPNNGEKHRKNYKQTYIKCADKENHSITGQESNAINQSKKMASSNGVSLSDSEFKVSEGSHPASLLSPTRPEYVN